VASIKDTRKVQVERRIAGDECDGTRPHAVGGGYAPKRLSRRTESGGAPPAVVQARAVSPAPILVGSGSGYPQMSDSGSSDPRESAWATRRSR